MTVRHVAHVFPYDTRHLGQDVHSWVASQIRRWPLAAIARSDLADRSSVHVIADRTATLARSPLRVESYRGTLSGPRWRDWGDDWSRRLGRALSRLGPQDIAVIHLNDYEAARLAQRSSAGTRSVLVFHGRGVGRYDSHLSDASALVVLRRDAAEELIAMGARRELVRVLQPSVDRATFAPPAERPRDHGLLGFVGRIEPAKGVLELPAVVARARELGIDARLEVVGSVQPGTDDEMRAISERLGVGEYITLLGEATAPRVADMMRRWRLLLLPSYSEGFSIVVVEAAACGLPVAVVQGVLPEELELQSLVESAPRHEYADLVADLLDRSPPTTAATWPIDHADAAQRWDELLLELPDFHRTARVRVQRVERLKRLRPARRAVRAVRRWLPRTRRLSSAPPSPS